MAFEELKGINLFIRKKPTWINYVSNVQEFKEFIDNMVFDKPIVIGDVSVFTKPMRNMLLKLLEENKYVSLYSSTDIGDSVLLSRVACVEKEAPSKMLNGLDIEKYEDSPRDYQSVASNLAILSYGYQLRATKLNPRYLNLLISQNGKID